MWSQFNTNVTRGLLVGARTTLEKAGIAIRDEDVFQVPGAFELALVCQRLLSATATRPAYDAALALGCVIKGDTLHFEFVSVGTTLGIQQAMLQTGKPIVFGVLTTQTEEQAIARSRTDDLRENKGAEAARACLDVLATLERIDAGHSHGVAHR